MMHMKDIQSNCNICITPKQSIRLSDKFQLTRLVFVELSKFLQTVLMIHVLFVISVIPRAD